eukprot:10944105-Prorocentrum_lima.AAC.1
MSLMRSMWHDAHVHHSWGEPLSSKHVPDRCTLKRHLFGIGHTWDYSGIVSWHVSVGVFDYI